MADETKAAKPAAKTVTRPAVKTVAPAAAAAEEAPAAKAAGSAVIRRRIKADGEVETTSGGVVLQRA